MSLASEREALRREVRQEYARLLDMRDWEVHFRRWATHEIHGATSPDALLSWLPEEMLDHVLPTNRTVRAHLELQKSEGDRVLREMEERMNATPDLTDEQLRRKWDPIAKEYAGS